MHSALLPSGKLISANEYDSSQHGIIIFCMDPVCKAPVIFVHPENTAAYFKTSGKGESVHTENCGFFQALSFQGAISKVTDYQHTFKNSGIKETLVRMNLNVIDPDYQPKLVEREEKAKEKTEGNEVKIKKDGQPPQSISSLKAIKKLFTTYEPDILAGIVISIKGNKVPISYLIREYSQAHEALWADELNQNLPYFVHGTIEKIVRREKVWYINFMNSENNYFSLVVFENYFKHFTYKDDELQGKEILSYGFLKKNAFVKERKSTEMIIKSNKYIEFL